MTQPHEPQSTKTHIDRKKIIFLGFFILLLYVLVPQLKTFQASIPVVKHAHIGWLVVGFGLALATYLAAAAVYYVVALRRLRYGPSVVVQFAGMFVNRLLPAGIGAIGINYRFLRKNKHTQVEAGAVVGLNNTLGIAGHILLLGLVVLVAPKQVSNLAITHKLNSRTIVIALIISGFILATIVLLRRRQVKRLSRKILKTLSVYKRQPLKLLSGLSLSVALTSLYGLCLLACTEAIGLHLAIVQVFVVLTLSVAGGTAIPTPGGLGGAEAGIVAGLVVYNVPASDALAVALLYRVLTYWLPLVFGGIALGIANRRRYI